MMDKAIIRGCILLALVGTLATRPEGIENPDSARIVVAHAPGATVRFAPQPAVVEALLGRSLERLTGEPSVRAAWRSLVRTEETVGIKVYSRPGAISGTRPPVVEAVIRGLLDAGMPPDRVVVWDRTLADLRLAGFVELAERYGVGVAGSAEAGFDEEVFYETSLIGQLVWGDLEFGRSGSRVGRRSFASKLLTGGMAQIISVVPLLNNNHAGVSGHCWGLAMSSVDNTLRFEANPARLAEAVPELLALEGLNLRDRVVLAITDAMLCQFQGEERQLLHYSTVLDQLWLGRDPVALDVAAIEEIERHRRISGVSGPKPNLELFENCSLLELGISQTHRIERIRLTLPPPVRPPP
jgi:hypothetical protein